MPPKVVLGGFCPCWGEFRRTAAPQPPLGDQGEAGVRCDAPTLCAPGNSKKGSQPLLGRSEDRQGEIETPLGCLSSHRQRHFLSTWKERGAEPCRSTAPRKNVQTGGASPSPTLRRCGKIRAVERRLLSASRHQKAGRSGERPAFWYRRRESNPYGAMPGDFKSPVSTCSTTPAYLRILPSRAARVKGRAEKTPAVRFGRRADFQIAQALR